MLAHLKSSNSRHSLKEEFKEWRGTFSENFVLNTRHCKTSPLGRREAKEERGLSLSATATIPSILTLASFISRVINGPLLSVTSWPARPKLAQLYISTPIYSRIFKINVQLVDAEALSMLDAKSFFIDLFHNI